MDSPDKRLRSSKAEVAEVGAEEMEEAALLTAAGAGGPEIREQPRRESSAVRESGRGHKGEVKFCYLIRSS